MVLNAPAAEGTHGYSTSPDSTRQLIHDAALRLFGTLGFAGTGIRLIAQEAGVSLASLYHYMSSKEELLEGMLRENILTLLRDAEVALQARKQPTSQIRALVRVHVHTHATDSLLCIVSDTQLRSLSEPKRAEIIALRDVYERLWRDVIQRGVDANEFSVRDVPVAASALLDMCTGIVHWYRADGRLSLDELVDLYIDMSMQLLGRSASRKTRNRE